MPAGGAISASSRRLVGVVLQAQGRLPEALAEHEAGKRIMQELTTRDPDNADWQREPSSSHNRVGAGFSGAGRVAEGAGGI